MKVRTVDEERAAVLLRPLLGEGVATDLVDFLVQRVGGAMLVSRLEGRRDREFEIYYEQQQARPWASRIAAKALGLTSPSEEAVRELLFLAAIEGMSCLSRGGKGCVFRAVEALRPEIAKLWADGEEPHDLLRRFYPEPGATDG